MLEIDQNQFNFDPNAFPGDFDENGMHAPLGGNPFGHATGGIDGNFLNGPIEEEDERNSLVRGGPIGAQQN